MKRGVLSAFADEYATLFEEQLRGLSAFGIEHVELRHLNGKNIADLSVDEVKEAKRMLDASNIRVSAIGSPLGKIKLDGDMDAHMETARRIFSFANILRTNHVRIFSFYAPDGKNIADMIGISVNYVSVKATTEEGMGFTGRLEGISAHSVCLIEKV